MEVIEPEIVNTAVVYTDCMVDIETTGTFPDRNAMIQLTAVRFNLETGEVDPNFFNRCLDLPPHRFWDEGTRQWWSSKKQTLLSIWERMENPQRVMAEFVNWASPANSLRFWSKPSHFDYLFISSYCRDYELPNPFDFREATDMRSWIRGRYFPAQMEECPLPFEGTAHDALFDTLDQIKRLFWYYERTKR